MKKNVMWALGSKSFYVASQWLVTVLIVQLANVETLGNFSYCMALVAPVIMFSQLNMRAVQIVDVNDEKSFSTYLAARYISMILASAVLLLICVLHRRETLLVGIMLAVICMKGAESISDIYQGVFIKAENQRGIAISTLLRSLALLVFVALSLALTHSLVIGLWLVAASWILLLLCYDRRVSVTFAAINYRDIAHLLWVSFPFGMVMGLAALIVYIPMYATKGAGGAAEAGYLSVLLYFFSLGRMVMSTVIEVYLPRLAKLFHAAQYDVLWQLTFRLLALALLLGVGGLVFARWFGDYFFAIFYGPTFSGLTSALTWMMIAGLIGYLAQLLFALLTLARLGWEQFFLLAIVAGACALASWHYVPVEGALGAAKALSMAMLTMALVGWIALWLKLPQLFVYRTAIAKTDR